MTLKAFTQISCGAAILFVALMAVVHTPQGLMLWGRLRGTERCPLGMDAQRDPESREAQRLAEGAALRGDGRARSSQFLGFDLKHATRSDVASWAHAQGALCHTTRTSPGDLECKVRVEADASSDAPDAPGSTAARMRGQTMFFAFDPHDKLSSIHAMTDYTTVDAAMLAFAQLRAGTDSGLGQPPKERGEASAAYLSAGLLRQVAAEYRLEDVYARLSATHMSAQGYTVEAQYRAIAD